MKSLKKGNKLAFNKANIVELNTSELKSVRGGAVSTVGTIVFPSSIIIFTKATSKI